MQSIGVCRIGRPRSTRTAGLLLALPFAASLALGAPEAQPLPKSGACPSGYHSSGSYCKPGRGARYALTKSGACPSGYTTSGTYCLAGARTRTAVSKVGACPSGYSTSGNYCVSSK